MNHNERFGALRATLQHAPSPSVWKDICAMARAFSPEAYVDQVEPYAQDLLQTWPDHLRVTPRSWTKALIRGKGFPAIRLCRHLDLSRFVIKHEQIITLLHAQKYMQALRVLNLTNVHINVEDLKALYQNPALSRIQHLNAGFECTRFNNKRSAFSTFERARIAQHELTIMLPLKSLIVDEVHGVQGYLTTPQAQELSYLKLGHHVRGYSAPINKALHGIELPRLRHFVMHMKDTYGQYDKEPLKKQIELLAQIKATESTWLGLSAKSYTPHLIAQKWTHTKDFVLISDPDNHPNQEHGRALIGTLEGLNPLTRMHMIDTPIDFSWHTMSHTLEALRASVEGHTP